MLRRLLLVYGVLVFAAVSTAAWAEATVVVKPSSMGGWVTAERIGYQKFVDPVPSSDASVSHSGTGAWYCYTGTAASTNPEQGSLWIGTNQFAGTRLDQIQMLKYKTWTDDAGIWSTRTDIGHPYRQLNPPRQPVVLDILIDIDPENQPGVQRYIMYRPYGSKNQGLPGSAAESCGGPTRHWKEYDGVAEGYWLEIQYGGATSTWVERFSWWEILADYPNAAIAGPTDVGWNWPAYDTPTGCALNFNFGAQHRSGNTGGLTGLASAWNNWWRDAANMRGFLDDFTIGIGPLEDPQQVEYTTFDFEADAPSPAVAIGGSAARSGRAACGIDPSSDGNSVRGDCAGSDDFTFVAYGFVLSSPAPGLTRFYMTDGGKRMEIINPEGTLALAGQFVRVSGYMQVDYGCTTNSQGVPTDLDDFPGGDPSPLDWNDPYGPMPSDIHPRIICPIGNVTILCEAPAE